MKILLTNDDGIFAPGLWALYKELKKIGSVVVVAPDSERSSVGHGITLTRPIWYKKMDRNGKFFGYGLSGTPADCVKFAIRVLMKEKPDLVVSGINLGPNDGCSVFYSGTVAGAREGAMQGIPSLAVSLGTFVRPKFDYAAKIGAKLAKLAVKNGLPQGTFLNVNVPNISASKIKGLRIATQGTVPIRGYFTKCKEPNSGDSYWMSGVMPKVKLAEGSDTKELGRNYVTISPSHCDLTDYDFMARLADWKF